MGQKEKLLILDIKPSRQENGYECGLSSVMTILKTMNIRTRKEVLRRKLGTTRNNGTPPEKIKALFDGMEVDYVEKHKGSLADIKRQLKASKMCLVAYQAWGSERYYKTLQSGHYSVIFGVEHDYLWLADPFVRKSRSRYGYGVRKIRKEVFLSRWKDSDYKGEIYDRWMLAI